MERGAPNAALHLKIVVMHEDRIREGVEDTIIRLFDLKMVLMPRQWLLKKLDPDNKLTVPALRMLLEDDMLEYKALIVNDWVDPRFNVKDVLRIYRKFNLITPAPSGV